MQKTNSASNQLMACRRSPHTHCDHCLVITLQKLRLCAVHSHKLLVTGKWLNISINRLVYLCGSSKKLD